MRPAAPGGWEGATPAAMLCMQSRAERGGDVNASPAEAPRTSPVISSQSRPSGMGSPPSFALGSFSCSHKAGARRGELEAEPRQERQAVTSGLAAAACCFTPAAVPSAALAMLRPRSYNLVCRSGPTVQARRPAMSP